MYKFTLDDRYYKSFEKDTCLIYEVAHDSFTQEIQRTQTHQPKCEVDNWKHICQMQLLDPQEIYEDLCLYDIYSTCEMISTENSQNKSICKFEAPHKVKEYCLCKTKEPLLEINGTCACICHTTCSTKCIQSDETKESCDVITRKKCVISFKKTYNNDTDYIYADCVFQNCTFPFEPVYFNTSNTQNDTQVYCNDYMTELNKLQSFEYPMKLSSLYPFTESGTTVVTTNHFLLIFVLLFQLMISFTFLKKIRLKRNIKNSK